MRPLPRPTRQRTALEFAYHGDTERLPLTRITQAEEEGTVDPLVARKGLQKCRFFQAFGRLPLSQQNLGLEFPGRILLLFLRPTGVIPDDTYL